jgi:hypothetical protein
MHVKEASDALIKIFEDIQKSFRMDGWIDRGQETISLAIIVRVRVCVL